MRNSAHGDFFAAALAAERFSSGLANFSALLMVTGPCSASALASRAASAAAASACKADVLLPSAMTPPPVPRKDAGITVLHERRAGEREPCFSPHGAPARCETGGANQLWETSRSTPTRTTSPARLCARNAKHHASSRPACGASPPG